MRPQGFALVCIIDFDQTGKRLSYYVFYFSKVGVRCYDYVQTISCNAINPWGRCTIANAKRNTLPNIVLSVLWGCSMQLVRSQCLIPVQKQISREFLNLICCTDFFNMYIAWDKCGPHHLKQ